MTTSAPSPLARLPKDLRAAATTLGRDEARYLVDSYYQLQDFRKAARNQLRSLAEAEEPHETIAFFGDQFEQVEKDIARALDAYSNGQLLGQWARQVTGIGPVIAAGLLAHIDIERARTAGAVWRFAGLDPSLEWKKGQKRPYNADLKVLCWKIGDSFVKVSGSESAFYGQLYRQRKEFEVARDLSVREVPEAGWYVVETPTATKDASGQSSSTAQDVKHEAVQIGERWFVGGNAKAAASTLSERTFRDKATRLIYEDAHLPPGRLDLRARRYAVKMFLAHFHEEGWKQLGKAAPVPYALTLEEHTHPVPSPVPSLA